MSQEPVAGRFATLWRDHAWVRWTVWLLLCCAAAYSLLFAGYARPTLYEGF